jgi:hypothetical protein
VGQALTFAPTFLNGDYQTMKKLLLTAALCAFAAPVCASDVTVTGYSLPDANSFVGYPYFTGPITFALSGGSSLTVYSADLNHVLQNTGTYALAPLTMNGLGQAISEFDSNRIGHIALLGFSALKAALAYTGNSYSQQQHENFDEAAAAQAAIWGIEYHIDPPVPTAATVEDLTAFIDDVFPNTGWALALDPVGEEWFANPDASQQMVVGLTIAPEPSTWAMGLIGFGAMAGFAAFNRRKAARYIEV